MFLSVGYQIVVGIDRESEPGNASSAGVDRLVSVNVTWRDAIGCPVPMGSCDTGPGGGGGGAQAAAITPNSISTAAIHAFRLMLNTSAGSVLPLESRPESVRQSQVEATLFTA